MMRKNGSGQSLRIRRKRMRFKINMSFLCREWEGLLSTLREEVTGSLLLSYFCLWKYYSYSVLNLLQLLHLSLLSRFYRIVVQLVGTSRSLQEILVQNSNPTSPKSQLSMYKKEPNFRAIQNQSESCSLRPLFIWVFFFFFFESCIISCLLGDKILSY